MHCVQAQVLSVPVYPVVKTVCMTWPAVLLMKYEAPTPLQWRDMLMISASNYHLLRVEAAQLQQSQDLSSGTDIFKNNILKFEYLYLTYQ